MACNTILYVGNSEKASGTLACGSRLGKSRAPFFVDAPPSGVASRWEPLGYGPGGMGRNVQEV